ncbi:MAG: hypothetical protein Q6361_02895 [Candidatus Hermodarchaeota archaeon]|nr:hypothetical protein [Candidatus Hermodarchaeota archaeon]
MADTIDEVISKRLEVLSRSIFPVNYVFSKTYEYMIKHRDCAVALATTAGVQVNFTQALTIHPKLFEREGAFVYQDRLYYVKALKILNSHLVISTDQLKLPSEKDPKENVGLFVKAVKPYIEAVDEIIRKRFATIVVKISTRSQPLVLHRQSVKGRQILTISELLSEMNVPLEVRNVIRNVLFRGKPASQKQDIDTPSKEDEIVSATFLTLEDGRLVLPGEGSVQTQEFIELGRVPYHFENVEGPIPRRQIITSFLQVEHQTVAQLLEAYSELAFLPFFFDLYREQGGPPIRNVALLNGRLIIGRTPESNRKEGEFEIFLAKAGVEKITAK